jgi:hypothetical protein
MGARASIHTEKWLLIVGLGCKYMVKFPKECSFAILVTNVDVSILNIYFWVLELITIKMLRKRAE